MVHKVLAGWDSDGTKRVLADSAKHVKEGALIPLDRDSLALI